MGWKLPNIENNIYNNGRLKMINMLMASDDLRIVYYELNSFNNNRFVFWIFKRFNTKN